jgi:8-oxo-dGTP pyrophosphatase MutT (NUDIX family)
MNSTITQTPPKYATLVVFSHESKILLLLRGRTAPWKPLMWDVPGGAQEGDEEMLETALRELREEAGPAIHNLVASRKGSVQCIGSASYDENTADCFNVTYFCVQLDSEPEVKLGLVVEGGRTLCKNTTSSEIEWLANGQPFPDGVEPVLEHEQYMWCTIRDLPPQEQVAVDLTFVLKAAETVA